eukprot:1196071-Prorocentrum_minimum.AAC.10
MWFRAYLLSGCKDNLLYGGLKVGCASPRVPDMCGGNDAEERGGGGREAARTVGSVRAAIHAAIAAKAAYHPSTILVPS